MSTAMVSLENAPRDPQGLLQLKRGIRFRLAHQLGLFADETQEQAFMQAPDEQMVQTLLTALQQFDAQGGSAAQAPPATQLQLPPMGAPQMPPAAPQMPQGAPMGMPPVVPPQTPQAPYQAPPQGYQQMQMPMGPPATAGYPAPQMPPVVAPPAAPAPQMPPPMAMAPQAPPQTPYMPPMVAPPMAPPAGQQVVRTPVTKAAPAAVTPPQAAPQQALAAPAGQGQQVLQIQTQIAESLKKLADTSQKTQEWLEQQQIGQAQILHTILSVQLAMAEQAGIDATTLAKCVKAMDKDTVSKFLEALGSTEGK